MEQSAGLGLPVARLGRCHYVSVVMTVQRMGTPNDGLEFDAVRNVERHHPAGGNVYDLSGPLALDEGRLNSVSMAHRDPLAGVRPNSDCAAGGGLVRWDGELVLAMVEMEWRAGFVRVRFCGHKCWSAWASRGLITTSQRF